MNTRDQLNQYLRGLETRLRWMAVSKGAAIAAGVALGVTLAMVLMTNALAFSSTSLTVARVILFLALAVAVGFALVLPLMRLNQRKAAGRAEHAFPEFEQRLVTFVERSDRPEAAGSDRKDPMLELLAEDTASVARTTAPARVAPPKSIFAFATSAGAAAAALAWLILAGPGYFGYGASLLWAGMPKGTAGAYYDIKVDPGNKLVRRKADQMVTATLSGFQAPQVKLFAQYKSTSKWEEAPMLPRASGSAYEFLFAGLAEPVEYYVEAGGVRSKTYKLDVIDMPGIKKVKVTYHFPSWLHLPDAVEDPAGDLRAVAGTVAELTVETDRPLKSGTIEMDDGSHIALDATSNSMMVTAKVPIQKDGMYHFAANEQGQSVRLSEDYFIEARIDNAPNVRITHPGADAKVSPIEEVTIEVAGDDDFALEGMDLHYSVNGQPEKVVTLLSQKGVKNASGHTTLYLEDYKLDPGDVVAVYATARDARTTSRTDIMFIETQPYERNYTQSQQMGGGGAGGGAGRGSHLAASEGNHRRDLERNSRRRQGQSEFGGKRPVSRRSADQVEGAGHLARAARPQPRAGRRESGVPVLREGHGSGRRADGPGVRQAQGPVLEGCAGAGAESAATPAARRSHLPRHSGRVRRRRRRGRGRRRRPRSGQPVRPRAGHGKESVRDRPAAGVVVGSAPERDRRSAAKTGAARAAPAGARAVSAEQADSRAALAAGNAAPRSRRAEETDGAAPTAGIAIAARFPIAIGTARPIGPIRPVGTIGPIRPARPVVRQLFEPAHAAPAGSALAARARSGEARPPTICAPRSRLPTKASRARPTVKPTRAARRSVSRKRRTR